MVLENDDDDIQPFIIIYIILFSFPRNNIRKIVHTHRSDDDDCARVCAVLSKTKKKNKIIIMEKRRTNKIEKKKLKNK